MSPYREPWGGYDLEAPVETPEQRQARVWAIQACDTLVTVWQTPLVTYTQAYCVALGHIYGRPLWRDR